MLFGTFIHILTSLIRDFCTSDRNFASTFFQIPPHDGHPWSWLVVGHCDYNPHNRLSLSRYMPCPAYQKPIPFRKEIGFLLYIGNFRNKIVFFVYFEGYIEFFDGFLLYFPLQRNIFFRLWHAKINQAFCWFFYKPFNLVKRSPLFSLQSANTRSMVSFLCG